MSLNVVLTLLRLIPIRTSTRDNSVEIEDNWTGWLYQVPTRAIYSVLVCLILICYFITSIQNKLKNKYGHLKFDVDTKSIVNGLWHQVGGTKLIHCCPLRVPGLQSLAFDAYKFEEDISELSYGNLCEKVSAAENELTALRKALDLAIKSGNDLEESLVEAEKEKGEIVDRFHIEKQKRISEMETLCHDMSVLRQQLQSIKQERDEVKSKCASLAAEAQKAGVMLNKRQQIQGKLDEALSVVSLLKKAVSELETDRKDTLVSLSDNACHDENNDVENLEIQLENKLSSLATPNTHMFDRGDEAAASQFASQQLILDCDEAEEQGEDKENPMYMKGWNSDIDYYEPPSVVVVDGSPYQVNEQDYDDETVVDSEEESDDEMIDEEEQIRIQPVQLTNTEAFKMFVQSNFGSFEAT